MAGNSISARVSSALESAVLEEFEEIGSRVQEEESETTLNDRIAALRKFAPRYSVPVEVLDRAVSAVEDRIAQIEEKSVTSSSPRVAASPRRLDAFNDAALRDLFTPLLED